ncbi:MAG: SpoIIE family protein phosphatase, partial [Ilumatobacteraceae bacterium]
VVFYTDGITDAPRDGAVPIDDLERIIGDHHAATPDEIADAIGSAVGQRRPQGSGDDTALLILRNS